MTEAEYKALWKEGQPIFLKVVRKLNEAMPYSFDGAAADGFPTYRTEHSYHEICVALALFHRQVKRSEGETV